MKVDRDSRISAASFMLPSLSERLSALAVAQREIAKRAGVQRLIINGSFVTAIVEPNDVDCVLLPSAG